MNTLRNRLFILCCCLMYSARTLAQAYHYVHYTTRDGLTGETLYTITQDADGFMWFATETGLSRFDGQYFKNFTIADGLPSNEVFGFYEDTRKRLWIKSFSNKPCYYYKGKIYNQSNTQQLRSLLMTSYITAIIETRAGEIIFTDESGYTAVLEKDGGTRNYSPAQFTIDQQDVLNGNLTFPMLKLSAASKIVVDRYPDERNGFAKNAMISGGSMFVLVKSEPRQNRESILWFNKKESPKFIIRPDRLYFISIAEDSLLESYRMGGAGIFNLSTGKESQPFLPDLIVNGVYQDRDRNLWFATKWNGIYKLGNRNIINLTFNTDHGQSAIRFVHAGNGNIFAGDDKGYFGKISIDQPGQNQFKKTELNETVAWLKTNAPGRCINYNGSDFLHINYKGKSQGVKSLYLSGDTLLIAASHCTFLTKLGKPGIEIPIHKGRSTCAAKHDNCFYIGTLSGLFIYDSTGALLSKPLDSRISHFTEGQNGEIWVSTYDKGIFSMTGHRVTKAINTGNSLLSSDLVRCIFYRDGFIWAGTDKGINKISTTDLTVSNYTRNNGLNTDVINTIFVDSAMVYAGTAAGLNIFSKNLKISDAAFNLVFTGITVADTLTDPDRPVTLPHNDNRITFDFSGISFSTNRITYRYRLTGLSDQWNTTTEHTLSFISLPSGEYKLQVQAISPNGRKSTLLEKSFTVRKSMLEYWWVRLAVALTVIAGILVLVYFRIKRVRETEADKRETYQRMMELEQMALRAQMNPHFIFNCLNSVQNYILKQDAAGANHYLSEFAGLVRQTLENSSKLLITLQEEISYLKHYIELERLQVDFLFDYEIKMDKTIVASALLVPNMIIQPFVENALKHGLKKNRTKGRLGIDIRKEGPVLICTITDNGPGYNQTHQNKEKKHTSRGISLIEQRISTLNLMNPEKPPISFTIDDLEAAGSQGTRVVVVVPVILNTSSKND